MRVVCLTGQVGLTDLAHEEKKGFRKSLFLFPKNWNVEINSKKYLGVSERYEILEIDLDIWSNFGYSHFDQRLTDFE
jgi:hypothetical protein